MTERLSPEKMLELEEAAYQIRRLSLEMITYAKWGHPGGSFSMAEILAALFFNTMNIDPANPQWEGRDRLILSKAHGSPALYAALAFRGFFPIETIYTYCEPDGLEGHTDRSNVHGILDPSAFQHQYTHMIANRGVLAKMEHKAQATLRREKQIIQGRFHEEYGRMPGLANAVIVPSGAFLGRHSA